MNKKGQMSRTRSRRGKRSLDFWWLQNTHAEFEDDNLRGAYWTRNSRLPNTVTIVVGNFFEIDRTWSVRYRFHGTITFHGSSSPSLHQIVSFRPAQSIFITVL